MTDTADIGRFKAQLLRARDELRALQDARDAASETVELDQSRTGRLSRMDALQQQAMAQSGKQRAELTLRRIEAALRRCDDGCYGYCLECGEAIAPARLELDPAVTLCIACAQARER